MAEVAGREEILIEDHPGLLYNKLDITKAMYF